jgi:hypothetical protein
MVAGRKIIGWLLISTPTSLGQELRIVCALGSSGQLVTTSRVREVILLGFRRIAVRRSLSERGVARMQAQCAVIESRQLRFTPLATIAIKQFRDTRNTIKI